MNSKYVSGFVYVPSGGETLYTNVLLPEREGKFPTVIFRNPYVSWAENATEEKVTVECLRELERWLGRGYTVVHQHCRGTGKSSGDFIPYLNEHEDSNNLYDWVRRQPFYNGELFLSGNRHERFGPVYEADWFDYIRGLRSSPVELGKVTYYSLFENKWKSDDFVPPEEEIVLPLGQNTVTYKYNPYDPPSFKGGLSTNFDGAEFQDKPNSRHDIISVYTAPFPSDTLVKGKIRAKLVVSSDREDTCFVMRVSIEKERGDFPLRDDITTLCYALGDYTPGEKAEIDFAFDEHAFLIRRGERLRVDVASADSAHYVRHTNLKGLYSAQDRAVVAKNTVYLGDSCLIIPKAEQ